MQNLVPEATVEDFVVTAPEAVCKVPEAVNGVVTAPEAVCTEDESQTVAKKNRRGARRAKTTGDQRAAKATTTAGTAVAAVAQNPDRNMGQGEFLVPAATAVKAVEEKTDNERVPVVLVPATAAARKACSSETADFLMPDDE